MKFQFSVPSVSKRKNELNLDHSHILTHNFGVQQIVSVIDLIPNSDVTVDLSSFTRLMPLPCPTYGGVKVVHRAYFVPLEFCFKGFNDFVSFQKQPQFNTQYPSNSVSLSEFKMPYFTVGDIFDVLCGGTRQNPSDDSEYIQPINDSDARHDLAGQTGNGVVYYTYTVKGRKLVTWLSQLGYKIPPFFSYLADAHMDKKYCPDALFSFWKYYLDWVVPARFVLNEPRFVYVKSILDNLVCFDKNYHLISIYDESLRNNSVLDLAKFLMVPTSFLDDDHYTTSFVTPYGVENSSSKLVSDTGQTLLGLNVSASSPQNAGVTSSNDNVPFVNNTSTLSQLTLLSLGRLQQLVNSKKITSTNVLDFLRTNYGVAPSHDVMRLSSYLGNFDSQIMIGDVMATASTDSQVGTTVVGQFAGKGLGGSSAKWRVGTDQHGILFITAEITTKSSYVNGVSPLRSRFNALDFFNEKFDNVGVRAVRHDELVFNTFESLEYNGTESYPSPSSIFGFQPRYSEYKFHDDLVSGDFMFPSVNTGLDSWYLNRKFKFTDDPKIGLEFLSATSDSVGSQYDRIFQVTDNVDHFYSVYRIDVHETSIKEKFLDYFKTLNDTDEDKDSQDVLIN